MAQPFPAMTAPQVQALRACVAREPALEEWSVRFNRAWEAATN